MGTKKTTVKKTTAKRKTVKRKTNKKTAAAKPKTTVQEALEVTWVLKGHLKNIQIAYIRVGKMLSHVRDKKLYEALKHKDMESYAEARLQLGRASYYRYIQVYDWIREFHKEWLEPKPKGFIPELADAANLMWIERELTRKDLTPEMRATLEALRKKALEGWLRDEDMAKVRTSPRKRVQDLKSILSAARALRRKWVRLINMPPEVIPRLDALIEIIENAAAAEQPTSAGA